MATRREFLAGAAVAATLPRLITTGIGGPAAAAEKPSREKDWDQGAVQHLIPTASHDRFLIKASFAQAQLAPPELEVGSTKVRGQANTPSGDFWQFDVTGLKPATPYRMSLKGAGGRALCEPWQLATFPAPDATPERLRLMIYTCGGGHEGLNQGLPAGTINWLPSALRRRLLARGLSFKPDALIANGDQIYWDLRAPQASKGSGASPLGKELAGIFDRAQPVFGTPNEAVFRRATGAQIIPQYGALLRSTPVFFMQDDHDYFDNDEATDDIITFPPDAFMLALARATRQLYYPEYLPDRNRPLGLPGASAADRPPGVGEAFGTLRYGKLAEILLYDVRRTQTLAGPSAVFVDGTVETWLRSRMTDREMIHLVNIPSNPPGWSAGKWGEWYPDVLSREGKLTTDKPKPYWQSGWLKQHDRLMAEVAAMPGRIPLVISGDLHAIAEGHMQRSGALDFGKNPVVVILSGPLGTGDRGWPSAFRGIGATPSTHLTMVEDLKPIEENGFIIADFTKDGITVRYFRFSYHTQSADAIDTLEPFRVTELKRP
ncbi:MAG TPA: hypothetical protein VHJ00_02740 [Bradyrhizobium sp.]|nr:hypothetical protein [Bradyrhizobium sp.]